MVTYGKSCTEKMIIFFLPFIYSSPFYVSVTEGKNGGLICAKVDMLELLLELTQEKLYHVGLSFIICKMKVVMFI